jgi:hypothetical protein
MASADDETREDITASNKNADLHQPENPRKKRKIVPPETASSALMNTLKNPPPDYQHMAKGKIFSIVQEVEGQAFVDSPAATSHCSRDSWDNSSPAIEIADSNITALTPQQPPILASYSEKSHAHSN